MTDTNIKQRLERMIRIIGKKENLNEDQINTIVACVDTVLKGGPEDTNSYLLRVFDQIGGEGNGL
tara:strand:- start:3831 stop:4025 length:195 start_codon:yes stop_codon:yes gene_type:complete